MRLLTTTIVLLSAYFSFGQTISTDAPSVSAGATTVGQGVFQIESRFQYTRTRNTSNSVNDFQLPSILFRVGLGKNFELRLINGIELHSSTFGSNASLSNFVLGMKAQLLNKPDGNTQIAFLVHAQVPEIENTYFSGTGTLAVNHNLNENNSLGYNVGFTYSTRPTSYESHSVDLSLIYSHTITSRISLFAEVYGGYRNTTTPNFNGSTYLDFDAGFMFLLKDNIQLDYSFGASILDKSNFHALGLNFMFGGKE
ncbi:MAG: transporter [Crocinitomicaceae bacterium]|nr:transporter [Crocinitomicaceae bacterium]